MASLDELLEEVKTTVPKLDDYLTPIRQYEEAQKATGAGPGTLALRNLLSGSQDMAAGFYGALGSATGIPLLKDVAEEARFLSDTTQEARVRPQLEESFGGQVIGGAAQSIPPMMGFAVNPALGYALTTSQIYEGERDRAIQAQVQNQLDNTGTFDPALLDIPTAEAQAAVATGPAALLEGAADRLTAGLAGRGLRMVDEALSGTPANVANLAIPLLGASAAGAGSEAAQSLSSDIIAQDVFRSEAPDTWQQRGQRAAQQAAVGAVVPGVLAGPPILAGTIANKISSAREAASAGMPATADTLAQQAYNELTQPTDEATGVSPTQEQPTEQEVGKTLDELISEVASQPASAPDLAGVTTTEEVVNEPITNEQASDRPAQEEASQETQEEVDPLTNEPTIITGSGRPDRARISERNREILGRLASQNLQAAERGNVEQSVENLWEGPIPEQTLKYSLKRIKSGKEATAYESESGTVYKLFTPDDEFDQVGWTLAFKKRGDEWVVDNSAGTLDDAAIKIADINAIGGIPSEIVGISDAGSLIIKQPKVEPIPKGKLDEAREAALRNAKAVSIDAPGFEKVWITISNGEPIAISDLHAGNLAIDSDGEYRILDANTTTVPQRVIDESPAIATAVERAYQLQQPAVESAQPTTPDEETTTNPQTSSDRGSDVAGQVQEDPSAVPEVQRLQPEQEVTDGGVTAPVPTISEDAVQEQISESSLLRNEGIQREGELQAVGEGDLRQAPTQESPQEEVASRKLEPESEFTRLATRGTGENPAPSEIDKIVTRLGVPVADVQDVAQDVAIKASQSYDPAGGATPLTWANSIAKTTVADYFRRQSAQKRDVAATVSTETPITEDVTVGESLVAPQRPVATDESAVQVAEALAAELTETEKTIIQRVVQGRETQTAVAKSLNLSQTRVSQIQKSALLKLKKQMQDRGFSREDIAFDEREEFPNFGPGAANILEFLNRPRTVTSTMNRVANEERAIRGELPVLMEAIQSNQETFDRAEALVEKNPNIGREIVVGLLNGTKTQVSEIDEAVLLYEKIRLRNEREMEVERASDPYESPESREEATKRWRELEEQITQLDQATRRSGTIWGRLGQFRQRLMRDDYTFEAMERKARVSKGRPLTAQESEEIRAQAERIAELEQQLAEAQRRSTEKGRVKATDEKLTELKTQATKRNATKKNVDLAGQSRNITERIKKRVDEGSDLSTLRGLVQRLALNFVRQGANTREVLVDAVHAVLSRIIPDIQRNTTMDLISGYGDFKPLDKEPAKQTLRELKGELQQLGKIGDMLNKQAPKKTGTERRTPSAEERRLIKEVNELKKRGGFEVTDPEAQLKSALDAIKTRLRNQIEDLDKAIADKEPLIQKDGSIEYDAEAAELRSRRDQLKLEYDEIFPAQPLSEEELIAKAARNLDRSIQRLEDDIKEGRLYPGAKPKQLSTPELEAKRATLEALRADRENLRNLDTQRVEMQKEAALRAAIDRAQDEIPNKTRGVDTVDTEEVARLKLELEAAKERRKAARNADVEYAEARRESVLLRAIERAQTASQKERGSPYTADTKRVAELKAQLAEIREAQAESPEAKQRRIDEAIKNVEESIRSYDQRIQEGDFAVRQTPEGPISDELEALQAERDAMRRLFNELRAAEEPKKTKEEIQLQSYKTRTLNRIAELQRKLLENDFAPPQKRDPVKLDAEGKKLEEQLYQAKKEYNEARFKDELKRRPLMRKIWDEGRHVLSTARAMMTSIDLSMIFRQAGFITIGNPNRAWKALPGMFRALRNERVRREVNADIWKRPNAEMYRQSKLAITNPDETNMNKMEEAYMTRWASKIPGVAASERAYTTFLNLIRADTFDTLVATLGRDGAVSKEEADALANYVNVATGRGNLAGASGTGFTLNSVFFAPRLLWSRFELLAGQPFYKGSKRTRNLVLREYAKFLIGIATLYNLALAAGFEVEWDPRSSDFGKIRFGNVRIDPLAGLAQVTTLLSRVFSGQKKTLSGDVQDIRGDNIPYGGETTYDVAGRFLRTKLNPALGAVVDLSVGRNVIGEKVTPVDALKRSVTPLSMQDVTDVYKEYGIPTGTALTLLEMIGFGVQNFETNNPQPSSQAP